MPNPTLARSLRNATRLNQADSEPIGILAASTVTELPLSAILPRLAGDTRPLHPANVANLAESIAALGLLEPIVLDRNHRLIAGNHRRMAAMLLAVEGEARRDRWIEFAGPGPASEKLCRRIMDLPQVTPSVPVRILPFNAQEQQDLALGAEIAENEQRQSYSKEEVVELANRLRSIGIRDSVGRPQAGQAALVPCLTAIVRKSESTVRRMLAGATPSSLMLSARTSLTPREKLQKALHTYLEADDPARTAAFTSAIQAIIAQLNAAAETLDVDPERLGIVSTVSF